MPFSVANALQQNYPDPIGIDQLKRRNALAERDQNLQEQNALAQQDYYKAQTSNMLRDDERATTEARAKQAKEWLTNAIGHARQNPQAAPQLIAQGKQLGYVPPDFPDQMAPEQIEEIAMQLGIAPAAVQKPDSYTLGPGQTHFVDGKPVASVAPKPEKPDAPRSRFRALTKEEISSSGLPPGSSAQIDEATGKIDVLSKKDTTGGLSQKDATTAKIKLNTVKLARKQLENIKQKFGAIKGGMSAGPGGQGRLPTPGGQAFDAAVNQMRSTLTALTRVPGVGAMSDYETKLDQSKFPDRTKFESVTADQLVQLDNMLNAIETGYSDLLSGNAPSGGGQEDPLGIR